MKWMFEQRGEHVYVKVYMNGALCGNLCFRHAEFQSIMDAEIKGRWNKDLPDVIEFECTNKYVSEVKP